MLEAISIMKEFGIVGARAVDGGRIENQFFGIAKREFDFFTNDLIPQTADSIAKGRNGWAGHEQAMLDYQVECLGGGDKIILSQCAQSRMLVK